MAFLSQVKIPLAVILFTALEIALVSLSPPPAALPCFVLVLPDRVPSLFKQLSRIAFVLCPLPLSGTHTVAWSVSLHTLDYRPHVGLVGCQVICWCLLLYSLSVFLDDYLTLAQFFSHFLSFSLSASVASCYSDHIEAPRRGSPTSSFPPTCPCLPVPVWGQPLPLGYHVHPLSYEDVTVFCTLHICHLHPWIWRADCTVSFYVDSWSIPGVSWKWPS